MIILTIREDQQQHQPMNLIQVWNLYRRNRRKNKKMQKQNVWAMVRVAPKTSRRKDQQQDQPEEQHYEEDEQVEEVVREEILVKTPRDTWAPVTLARVGFSTVDVREFNYTINLGSVPKEGPPVGLGRKPVRTTLNVDIDTYETRRCSVRRGNDNLRLSLEDRVQLLSEIGHSADLIERASWEAEKIQSNRQKSIKNMDWDGWALASEKIARKFSKITKCSSKAY